MDKKKENENEIIYINNLINKITDKTEKWIVEKYFFNTLIKTYYLSKNEKEGNNE